MSDEKREVMGVVVPAQGKDGPGSLDQKSIRKALEASAKRMKKAEEKRNAAPEPQKGKCKVCGGVVTEEFQQHTDHDPMNIPMGPGSRGYYYWKSTGLACEDCGILYKHLPKK